MKILVTGAAGFIGAHAVSDLAARGHEVVATDVLPPASASRLDDAAKWENVSWHHGDLLDLPEGLLAGIDEVWHFAANADIPLGAKDTGVDVRNSIMTTHRLLDAMRLASVRRIVFPSTSSVYGNTVRERAYESSGPLFPASLYAAGKLSSEALISAYAHTFGMQGSVFRLGNVVGGQMARGIVRDFIVKLRADPATVHVLGDGTQRKSYVLIDDIVEGMYTLSRDDSSPVGLYNLAADGSLDVEGVVGAVAEAMNLEPPVIVPSDRALSWAGDQPVIELDVSQARAAGWRAEHGPREAVVIAARRLMAEMGDIGAHARAE